MNSDERVYNVGWYIGLTIVTWFSIISSVKYFKVNKEVIKYKQRIFELENIIIGKDDIIRAQLDFIKELESNGTNKRK